MQLFIFSRRKVSSWFKAGKKVQAKISVLNLETLNLRGDFFFFFVLLVERLGNKLPDRFSDFRNLCICIRGTRGQSDRAAKAYVLPVYSETMRAP